MVLPTKTRLKNSCRNLNIPVFLTTPKHTKDYRTKSSIQKFFLLMQKMKKILSVWFLSGFLIPKSSYKVEPCINLYIHLIYQPTATTPIPQLQGLTRSNLVY